MKYSFTGRNIALTDSLREAAQQKIGRLERRLPKDAEVSVIFSVVRHENTVEVTIPLKKRILRAEVTENDMYSALDSVIDVLDKQMVKYKTRLRDKYRKDSSYRDEINYFPQTDEHEEETPLKIERIKRFALKPMDAEEAAMEMELSGHAFYVFRNSVSDEVNVVYRRRDGSFGLIEPEY